ncbi:hypothetical protein AKJ16_DCAP03944 [Drosera capensis]
MSGIASPFFDLHFSSLSSIPRRIDRSCSIIAFESRRGSLSPTSSRAVTNRYSNFVEDLSEVTELNMYAEHPSQVMVKEFLFHERLKKKLPMTIPEMAILQLMLMCSNTHNLLMFTVSMLKLICRMIKRAQKKARRRSIQERKKIMAARKKRILKKEKFIRTRTGHIKGVFLRRRPMSLTKMQSITKFPSKSSILQVEHFKMIAARLKISVVPAALFQRLDSSGYCSPPPSLHN